MPRLRQVSMLVGGLLLAAAIVVLPESPAGAILNHPDDVGGVEPITQFDGPDFRDYEDSNEYAQALLDHDPELRELLTPPPIEPDEDGTITVPPWMWAEMWSTVTTSDGTRYDCGIVTCSFWWSWEKTEWLYNKMKGAATETAVTAVAGVVCMFGSAVSAVVCAGLVRARWQALRDHLKHALDTRTCSRWIIGRPTVVPGPLGPTVVTSITGYNRWLKHPDVNLTCKVPAPPAPPPGPVK